MATDFGIDVSTFPDLDPLLSSLTGRRVVGEAVARRLETPRGGLAFHPNYGTDVRQYLNEAITDAQILEIQEAIKSECEKDERVLSAGVVAKFFPTSFTLRIQIELELSDGLFRLVLAVSQLSVDLLEID
jgi:hypothetical protein